MATTYTLIQAVNLSSAASSITFTAIPATYTDLLIKTSLRSSSASGNSNLFMYFNGVTGTSYAQKRVLGDGSATGVDSQAGYPWIEISPVIPNATYTANTFGSGDIYIPNYASANYKSVNADFVGENSSSNAYSVFAAGLFTDTTAISTIALDGTDNFVQYSSAYLYGISNA
jgi:hypothetical protein